MNMSSKPGGGKWSGFGFGRFSELLNGSIGPNGSNRAPGTTPENIFSKDLRFSYLKVVFVNNHKKIMHVTNINLAMDCGRGLVVELYLDC